MRELADVIALCSLLVARGDRASCEPLWRAGARAVGWGADERYLRAKALPARGLRSRRGPRCSRSISARSVA